MRTWELYLINHSSMREENISYKHIHKELKMLLHQLFLRLFNGTLSTAGELE